MARYRVAVTDEFARALDEAVRRRRDSAGDAGAGELLAAFEGARDAVASFPNFSPRVGGAGCRWCAVGRYVAVFDVDDEARAVTMLALMHMSSDWRRRVESWGGLN